MSDAAADEDGAEQFGFTPAWHALGIVDAALLAELRTEWDKGKDNNPEHYRNWAFGGFITRHGPLPRSWPSHCGSWPSPTRTCAG